MPPSSPIFSEESDPFLDAEKATPPSPQNVARSLLRRAFHFRIHRINILHCLLPSFLRSRRNGIETSHPAQTAWLDGMRGLASFFVYNRHFASATHPNIQVGYGTDDKNRWIIQLPFFHLVVGGPAMVSLFFMISGYALSRSPLRAIHYQGSPEPCLMRLSSATFRRAARLFLPAVVSTFLVAICISLGLYDRGHLAYNPEDMPGFWEPEPPQWRNDPWNIQFKDWAANTWGFLKVWNPAGHAYDVHLWTLPVEFRCSIILFIALVGFARCKANIRLALLGATLVYCHYTDFWEGWLFFAGSFLAQLKLLQEDGLSASALPTTDQSTPKSDASPRRRQTPYPDALRICLFIIGLFLLSAPDYGYASSAPLYITISTTLTPASWPESWRYLHSLGAFLTVYSVSSTRTPLLRRLFSNTLTCYLGNISYALYLVHGPVVHMLGFWLVPWFWVRAEMMGMGVKSEVGFMGAWIVVTGVVVWAADLFWRGVDLRCVALAKWVERMVEDVR